MDRETQTARTWAEQLLIGLSNGDLSALKKVHRKVGSLDAAMTTFLDGNGHNGHQKNAAVKLARSVAEIDRALDYLSGLREKLIAFLAETGESPSDS